MVLKRKLNYLRNQVEIAVNDKNHLVALELEAQIFVVETLWGEMIRIEL